MTPETTPQRSRYDRPCSGGSVSKAPEYVIEKVWDFCAVPEDRLDACLREFATAIRVMRGTRRAAEAMRVTLQEGAFRWVDDGREDMTVDIKTAVSTEPTP